MYLNQFLGYILFKLNFLILTPKTYSFGGFYNSIFWGYKLKKKKKLKLIIAAPFLNIHERNIFSLYGLDIVFLILKKLSLIEKLLSIIFTIYLNFHLIILYILRKLGIWKLLSKQINFFFSEFIGFYDSQNLNDFFQKKINCKYHEILDVDINLGNLYEGEDSKKIAFCIKDNNYSKIKEMSSFMASNIKDCTKSLNYLINNNFKIYRVGEKTMDYFKFSNENYQDLYNVKNYKIQLNKTYAECAFYFGSSASHGIIPEIFQKKKILINHVEHLELSYSQSLDNYVLFKKIFCNKDKKFLSFNEIFKRGLFNFTIISDSLNKKLIKLEDNTEDEIFESIVEFYETNYKNKKRDNSLINKYLFLRKECLNNDENNIPKFFQKFKCNIPEFFLKKYLD